MSVSRWGLRGSEDLGGGLAAAYDLAGHFRLDTGESGRHPGDVAAGRIWTLASWVGLRGGFGLLRMGRVPTGSYVAALQFSPFGDSPNLGPFLMHTFVGSQPMLSVNGSTDGVWSNSISYTTPIVSGFSGMVQYVPSEHSIDGKRSEVTVNYRNEAFAVAANHRSIGGASVVSPRTPTDPTGVPYVLDSTTSTLISASYDFSVAKVYGQYSDGRVQPKNLPEISLKTLGASVQVPAGFGRFVASWAKTNREQANVTDRQRSTLSAGYIHNLSKRTELYGVAITDRATGLSSGSGYALGMRHAF